MSRDEIRKRYEWMALRLPLPGYVARVVSEERARLVAAGAERVAARMSTVEPEVRTSGGEGAGR